MITTSDLRSGTRARLLFRTDPLPLESPRGYLCRVAHAHRYNGPCWLADLAGIPPTGLASEDRAKDLAYALRLEVLEWLGMCHKHTEGRGRFKRRSFLGEVIDAFQLNYRRPRVCPCCLCERPVWWAVWDLALVTACPIHRCLLIDRCSACGKRLKWNRPAVHECRCRADLRTATPEAANGTLIAINAVIYRATGFQGQISEIEMNVINFPSALAELRLDSLLRVIRFLGSIQKDGRLRRKQPRFRATDFSAAVEVGTSAATLLRDWPRSFRHMLRGALPQRVENPARLNLTTCSEISIATSLAFFHRMISDFFTMPLRHL